MHYDKRSINASGTTNIVADRWPGARHLLRVLSSTELLQALRALRDDGKATNADLQRLLGLPSSRVSEIFAGKRKIQADEAAKIIDRYQLDDRPLGTAPTPAGDDTSFVGVQNIDQPWGLGAAFTDSAVQVEVLQFPKPWMEAISTSPPALLTWARARGDSMGPTIDDGDLVLLDRSRTRVNEQDALWAFTVGDTASIKRLRVKGDRFIILSDNKEVPDDEEPIDFVRIVGRVVFVGKSK